MSLFIGKENSGNHIMHVTQGVHTDTYMKAGVNAYTVFHNDLAFLSADIYTASTKLQFYNNDGTPYYCAWTRNEFDNDSGHLYRFTQVQSAGLEPAKTATLVYFLDANYNKIPEENIRWAEKYSKDGIRYLSDLKYTKSARYYIPCSVPIRSDHCDYPDNPMKYVVILSTKKIMQKNGVLIQHAPNSIYSTFVVGGLDIANIKYVSKGRICKHSSCILLDGFYEIIDASKISGGIEIISDSLSGTVIKKGGYTIFDANSGYIEGSGILHTFTKYVPSGTSSYQYLLPAVNGTIHSVLWRGTRRVINVSGNGSYQLEYETWTYAVSSINGGTRYVQGYWRIIYEISGGKAYLKTSVSSGGSGSNVTFTVEVFD